MIINPQCQQDYWSVCPTTQLADADNYYTKAEIDARIPSDYQELVDDVVTLTEEVQDLYNKMDEKADLSVLETYLTKIEAENTYEKIEDVTTFTIDGTTLIVNN